MLKNQNRDKQLDNSSLKSPTRFTCRMCASEQYTTVISYEKWLKVAKDSRDGRRAIANILERTNDLLFGDIVTCSKCDLCSIKNSIAPDALNDFYQNYYVNSNYASKRNSKINQATRRLQRLPNLSSAKTFLDVGCNQGFAVEAANRLGLISTGIEIDEDALQYAKANFSHNEFICKDICCFSEENRKFDIIYCSEVLEHAIDFRSFAKNIVACLADNGYLFLTTPDVGHFRTPRNLLNWAEIKPPEHVTWFRKKHMEMLFSPLGLEVALQFNLKPGIRMVGRKKATSS